MNIDFIILLILLIVTNIHLMIVTHNQKMMNENVKRIMIKLRIKKKNEG